MIVIFGLLFQTCTWTIDSNKNVLVGAGCTAASIFTNAQIADFHLASTSPAIGRAVCLPEVPFDFDGVPRPNRPPNFLFPGDTGCDIGAYQYKIPNPVKVPKNLRIISVK